MAMATKSTRSPLVLGELEQSLMEHLWQAGEADVTGAHTAVGEPRGITLNTVGSALERLTRKGLVVRWKVSRAYHYRPALDRSAFTARRMIESAGKHALADRNLLASFLDAVTEADASALDELERFIAEKREQNR
ncbi:MAG: BlaI/MecI/CopY family transcriptional regulator [Methylothermaceae bacterium]|nr:BlaI/MecI/CopY family transcriptional regulator [Methylothermaceae bacterium]